MHSEMYILKYNSTNYLGSLSKVSCGLKHTLVLSLDGMVVWAFGDGDYGKLGTGSSTAKYYPQVSDTALKLKNLQKAKHWAYMLCSRLWGIPKSSLISSLLYPLF